MFFNSKDFLIFFAVVFVLYRLIRNLRAQNLLLLVASYYFYGCWDWRFLGLIAFSTLVDYFSALRIESASTERARKGWLTLSMVSNLGLLGFFKYWDFGAESMAELLRLIGLEASPHTLGIILPVGISFYTFQSMSYTIDVFRKQTTPTRNLLDFSLYVAYFPQLVAGPIERSTQLLPQIVGPRRKPTREDVRVALMWCTVGYFQKVVLADTLGRMVDNAYTHTDDMTGSIMFVAGAAFALQVFCDFSGYSLIARGVSRLFGIDLMRNFRMPFLSRTTREAWQRWHISLSTWLRDYLYIPLGGSRGSKWMQYRNLFLTMLLGGLWHGAAWPKVLWGAWNGLILCFDKAFRGPAKLQHRAPLPFQVWQVFVTMMLWIFGLIVFRATGMGHAVHILGKIATDFVWTDELLYYLKPTLAAYAIIYAWFLWQEITDDELCLLKARPAVRTAIFTFLLVTTVVIGFKPQPFFYFQF